MDPSWELAQCSLFSYVMVSRCGHKRRHGTGSKQQFTIVIGPREGWSLNAEGSHRKCQIWAGGRTRGLGQSLDQHLYWDLQERPGRVNSVGLASRIIFVGSKIPCCLFRPGTWPWDDQGTGLVPPGKCGPVLQARDWLVGFHIKGMLLVASFAISKNWLAPGVSLSPARKAFLRCQTS